MNNYNVSIAYSLMKAVETHLMIQKDTLLNLQTIWKDTLRSPPTILVEITHYVTEIITIYD